MFYSSNENYMQDLYAYNQIPGNTYNPYIGNPVGVNNMMFGMNQTPNPNGMQSFNMNQGVNPNSLYPSIYRIINPVVNRVISRSNIPYLTEDILNNMVDTVYNIIEGQIEADDMISLNQTANQTSEGVSRNLNNANNTNNNQANTNNSMNSRVENDTNSRTIANQNNNSNNSNTTLNNSSRGNNRHDSLLRDLIKILILAQLLSRGNIQQNPYNFQNQFMQNPNFVGPGFYNQNF